MWCSNPAEARVTRYTIPDMSCDGCVNAITRAVQRLDAAARIAADLAAHTIDIQSTAPEPALRAALDDAGYTVQEA